MLLQHAWTALPQRPGRIFIKPGMLFVALFMMLAGQAALAGPVRLGPVQALDRWSSTYIADDGPLWLADLNGDECTDILVNALQAVQGSGAPASFWHENRLQASEGFPRHDLGDAQLAGCIHDIGDVDGDGDNDLLVWTGSNLGWKANNGAYTPIFSHHYVAVRPGLHPCARLADLDGDGDKDIVANNPGGAGLTWYQNNGARPPVFTARPIACDQNITTLAVGDINHDGRADIFVSDDGNYLHWIKNNGGSPPGFTAIPVSTPGPGEYCLQVWQADLDRDGDGDLLERIQVNGGIEVVWFENNGLDPPAFAQRRLQAAKITISDAQIVDLNGDGAVDVLATCEADEASSASGYHRNVIAYLNNGTSPAAFTSQTLIRLDSVNVRARAADLTGDGKPDLVLAYDPNHDSPNSPHGALDFYEQDAPPINLRPEMGQVVDTNTPKFMTTTPPFIHAASQWQVSRALDFAAPVYDSGRRTDALTTMLLPEGILTYPQTYYWRVRQQGADGDWTAWAFPTPFYTVLPRRIRVPKDYPTIQAAINAAADGQEVWVSQGTYPEQITLKSRVGVYGGFKGDELAFEERDAQKYPTILKPRINTSVAPADGSWWAKIVALHTVSSATLDGFTITMEPTQLHENTIRKIYGIYAHNLDASNRIANCALTSFTLSGGSAELFSFYQASPQVHACKVSGNHSQNSTLFEASFYKSSSVFSDCAFTSNTSGYGDWLLDIEGSSTEFNNCRFLDRKSGGIYAPSSRVTLRNCEMKRNGFGIRGYDSSQIIMDRCNVSSNDAGLYFEKCSATITNCIVADNRGGGVFFKSSMSPVYCSNCLITGNQSGGVRVFDPVTTISLVNCTIAGNHGAEGDGIWHTGSSASCLRVINTIISGHAGLAINDCSQNGMELVNCLFFQNRGGDYLGYHISSPSLNRAVTYPLMDAGLINALAPKARGNISGDPRFAAGDYRLQNGSAALDRATLSEAPLTDLQGSVRRAVDGKADIGAYEAAPAFIPATPSLAPVSTVLDIPFYTTQTLVSLPFIAWHPEGATSRITSILVYYRRNGGAWIQYKTSFSPNASRLTIDTRQTSGNGYYEFYTQALDALGHREAAPATPDAGIIVAAAATQARIYVNQAAKLQPSGADWAHGMRDLTQALELAKALKTSEIWVASGNYSLVGFVMWDGLQLYGGFGGTETNIAQRRIDDHPTTLTAYQTVVQMNATRAATLDGFIITNHRDGYINEAPLVCQSLDGSCRFANLQLAGCAGMAVRQSKVRLTGCKFIGNAFRAFWAYDSQVTLENCLFGKQGVEGSGIYCVNSDLDLTSVIFSDLVFGANSGQAIYSTNSKVHLSGCTIQRCTVGQSIYNNYTKSSNKLNQSSKPLWPIPDFPPPPSPPEPVMGAGIYAAASSKISLENCLIHDNDACPVVNFYYLGFYPPYTQELLPPRPAKGGVIFVEGASTLQVANCTFSGNRIHLPPSRTGAPLGGSAICGVGAAITCCNSIFTGNTLGAIYQSASTLRLDHCLFFGNSGGDYNGALSVPSTVIQGDPKFVNPTSSDYHLQSRSPAIDAGIRVSIPIVDLDGQPRGIKGKAASGAADPCYDLGVYEYQPKPATICVISPDGGERYFAGEAMPIAWWANGGSAGKAVRLELWNSKGKVADFGTVSNAQGYGVARCTIPRTLIGSDFRIRAQSVANGAYVDFSDALFKILAAKPNGVCPYRWMGYE